MLTLNTLLIEKSKPTFPDCQNQLMVLISASTATFSVEDNGGCAVWHGKRLLGEWLSTAASCTRKERKIRNAIYTYVHKEWLPVSTILLITNYVQ